MTADIHAERARRRQDFARQKRRARKVYPHDKAATNASKLAACSCALCGNPRRWMGEITLAERLAKDAGRADDGALAE